MRKRKVPKVSEMQISQEVKSVLDNYKYMTGLQYSDRCFTDIEERERYIEECREYMHDMK